MRLLSLFITLLFSIGCKKANDAQPNLKNAQITGLYSVTATGTKEESSVNTNFLVSGHLEVSSVNDTTISTGYIYALNDEFAYGRDTLYLTETEKNGKLSTYVTKPSLTLRDTFRYNSENKTFEQHQIGEYPNYSYSWNVTVLGTCL